MTRTVLIVCLITGLSLSCQQAPTHNQQAIKVAKDTSAASTIQPLPISIDFLLGKFDPGSHPDFEKITAPQTDKPGMMLHREAAKAFLNMWQQAKKEGITLKIISSTRTFSQQKTIWETKWKKYAREIPDSVLRARKIMEYSAMPGASRHHWGTDIDLNDLNNPAFEAGGKYEKLYLWLQKHANEYGFCQPYTAGRPYGYQEEKWHWTFTPLSKSFLEQYQKNITDAMITGFRGAETAKDIKIIKHYVQGINTACK